MITFGKYSKLYVAIATAVVSFVSSYFGVDAPIVHLVIGLIGAVGVYGVTNLPPTTPTP